MVEISEKYCILDTENWHEDPDNISPDNGQLRYVGFRNYKGRNVCYHYTEKEKIQAVIDYFPYIVGHNIKEYDIPLMERHGFKFNFKKQVFVDTLNIVDNRFKSMLYMDLNQGDRKLGRLAERLNLPHRKGEFDYRLLQKDRLEGQEYNDMENYLFGDLETDDDLFKWCYNMFYGFKQYMSEEAQRRMKWLINRPGSTAYGCICNLTGLPEEYSDVEDDSDVGYEGGFVSEPYLDFVEG